MFTDLWPQPLAGKDGSPQGAAAATPAAQISMCSAVKAKERRSASVLQPLARLFAAAVSRASRSSGNEVSQRPVQQLSGCQPRLGHYLLPGPFLMQHPLWLPTPLGPLLPTCVLTEAAPTLAANTT